MSEQDITLQDGTNPDENLDLDLDLDDNEEVETLKTELAKKDEAIRQLTARAKKAESAKPHLTKQETAHQEVKPSDILRADEFKLYRQGYNESEIDLIMHNGGIKMLEDQKSPLYLGLKASQEQRKAEEASEINDTVGLSDIERKYTPQDMRNMDTNKLEEIIGFAE